MESPHIETQCEAGQTAAVSDLQPVRECLVQVGVDSELDEKADGKIPAGAGQKEGCETVLAHVAWRRWYRIQCTILTSLYSKFVTFLY